MAPKDHNDGNHNDLLDGVVPEPDAEPTAAERAHAKTFAELVDKTLAGKVPVAMSADDRALLEVATVIRAASGNISLGADKRSSLVEDALLKAVGAKPSLSGASGANEVVGTKRPAQGSDIERARSRRTPWIVAVSATFVAAAAVLLWLRAPRETILIRPAAAALPDTMRSRPADPLIGVITREHAGDASARIDTIFADRLDGYRELRLRGTHRGRGGTP